MKHEDTVKQDNFQWESKHESMGKEKGEEGSSRNTRTLGHV